MGRKYNVVVSEEMYDRICRVLTDWETEQDTESFEETVRSMYETLVDITKLVLDGEQI